MNSFDSHSSLQKNHRFFETALLERADNHALLQQNQHLKLQIATLNDVNIKIGALLSKALEQLNINKDQLIEHLEQTECITPLNYIQEQCLPYLKPLFICYENKIVALQQGIQKMSSQVREGMVRISTLDKELQVYREQLQKKNNYIISLCRDGHPDAGMAQTYKRLQEDDLRQKGQIILKENQHILKSFNSLQSKLLTFQHSFEQAKQSNELLLSQLNELKNHNDQLQIQLQEACTIKDILQRKYKQLQDQNLRADGQIMTLQTKLQKAENQAHLSKMQVQNLKSAATELNSNYQNQSYLLEKQLQDLKRSERNQHLKNSELERDNEQLRQRVSQIRNQHSKLKSESQSMQTMLQNYDAKLTSLKRSYQLSQAGLQASKQREQNLILEVDKLQLMVHEKQQKMQLILDSNRQQIEDLKQSYQAIIKIKKSKQHAVDEDDQHQGQQTRERQRAKRQKQRQRQRANRQRQRQRIKNEQQARQQQKAPNKDGISEVLREKYQFNQNLLKQKVENMTLKLEDLEQQLRKTLVRKKQLEFELENKRKSIELLETDLKTYKQRSSSFQKENDQLLTELNNLRKDQTLKIKTAESQFASQMQNQQKRLNECVREKKRLKEEFIKKFQNFQRQVQQMKSSYQQRIRQIQLQNMQLKRRKV